MTAVWEWHRVPAAPRLKVRAWRGQWGYTCDSCFPCTVRVAVQPHRWRYLDAWSAAMWHLRDRHNN